MKNKPIKHKGVVIEETPSEKFPHMVTLTKCIKKMKPMEGKRFLDIDKAIEYINEMELVVWEEMTRRRLERTEEKRAVKELMKINGFQLKVS